METSAIFSKTEMGKSAITVRSEGLSAKQRQLLIMIDGKRRLSDIFPVIDDVTIARVESLFKSGLITSPEFDVASLQETPKAVTESVQPASGNGIAVKTMPNSQKMARIRVILAMCNQQYLNDVLDTLLTDYFDHLTTTEELQICLDHWFKHMKKNQPDSVTDMYLAQLNGLV